MTSVQWSLSFPYRTMGSWKANGASYYAKIIVLRQKYIREHAASYKSASHIVFNTSAAASGSGGQADGERWELIL